MPVSPNSFEYQFSPSTLAKVRNQMGLSQAKLAGRLELPVNTVSRWERGETTPDAHSLAAIYSIAKEQGLTPEFFQKRSSMATAQKKAPKPLGGRRVLNRQRTRLVMIWDFQDVELDADEAFDAWFYMDKYLDIAFPNINYEDEWELKVYASWEQREAVGSLRYFQVSETHGNADYQIAQDIRHLCGLSPGYLGSSPDPKNTVLVLASKDGDFADLLYEVDQEGVDVYLWALPDCSKDLLEVIRKDNIIPWTHPCREVSENNLRCLGR